MSKKKKKPAQTNAYSAGAGLPIPGDRSTIFIGPPELVLTSGTDYQEIWYDDSYDYWTPPINRLALARLPNANAQHDGVIYARKNMVMSDYLGGGLTRDQLGGLVFDWLLFGDAPLLKVRNGWGQVVALAPLPSMYLRRRKTGEFVILQKGQPLIYPESEIIFLKQYDPQQQVYGLPDYIGGINSALLNSEATVFRRRYYANGAHVGGILYTTDQNLSDELEQEIKKKIESTKGLGNFRNMFINIPGGDKEGVKFIPVGDISAKDEFSNVKNISAQDVLTSHRFPAGLAGIIPQNTAGLGDPDKARETYRKDEVIPVQRMLSEAVAADPEVPARLHIKFDLSTPAGE
ncbi:MULTISPECIES: phage portal protein [Serratia]|uniref:phage portal protein n=1 Tax=Serratia TaxID=613 RepID=UPI000CF6FA98|nr:MULTISPECIES: phage portal protein [Serratia]AVJ18305.1 phage portal protein [Serratia sp. MYb239]MEB6337900.1 phage portal protein [Serratia rhizosphaerae]